MHHSQTILGWLGWAAVPVDADHLLISIPIALVILSIPAVLTYFNHAIAPNRKAMVLDAISNIPGDFSIKDLQEQCPTVGIDLIRRILRQERNLGRLECLGRGPDARWCKK